MSQVDDILREHDWTNLHPEPFVSDCSICKYKINLLIRGENSDREAMLTHYDDLFDGHTFEPEEIAS